MIHSEMIYEIASNCYGCHTVPNERIVNQGDHRAGSDFDLVSWSQGAVRHNFSSSDGAPDGPTNRPISPEMRRRYFIVGTMVDMEHSLRNLSRAKEPGGAFHKAMVDRVNQDLKTILAFLEAVQIPELESAIGDIPSTVDTATEIGADLPDKIGAATKQFAAKYDGSELAAVDGMIEAETMGEAYKE
jgi:hypothetical protein